VPFLKFAIKNLNGSLTSSQVSSSLVVSGPLWTGPLHDAAYVTEMLNLAEQWGWVGSGKGTHLEKLLKQMVDESDPNLPIGYIKMDEVLVQNFFKKSFLCFFYDCNLP
jgi:tRNA G26 N,N-dimethylase Trm1